MHPPDVFVKSSPGADLGILCCTLALLHRGVGEGIPGLYEEFGRFRRLYRRVGERNELIQ